MNDLEFLREIFKDTRLHFGIGTITKLGLSMDQSTLRVMVNLLPENREILAEMTFNNIYDGEYPEINDLVLLGMADGDQDEAHVLKTLNTPQEPLPKFMQGGHTVKYSRPGQKLYLGSDTKVGIGHAGNEQSSPLVLGDVLINCVTDILNAFLTPSSGSIGQCALGPVVLDPAVTTALNNVMSKYVTTSSTNIISQIVFTERGP
jgi:hypothetical protein